MKVLPTQNADSVSVSAATTQADDTSDAAFKAALEDAGVKLHKNEAAEKVDGHAYVVWRDCRFSAHCTHEGLVFAASADGTHWSAPRAVPVGSGDAILPALAVDGRRLAVMFCTLRSGSVATYVVTSDDAGDTWSAARALSKPMPIKAFPRVGSARFLGDYEAISFVGGNPVGVYADASKTFDGRFHEGIYASSGRSRR